MAPQPQHQHQQLQPHDLPQHRARLPSPSSLASSADNGPSSAASPPERDAAADAKAVKRVRTSRPKVKTGCNNCKQRRIKCDEKRPACTQCVRSKKVCAGYPPPARSARPFEEIRIAPKPGPALLAAASGPGAGPGPSNSAPALAPLAPSLRPQTALRPRQLQHAPLQSQLQPQLQPQYQKQHHQVQIPPRRAQKLLQRRNLPPHASITVATPALLYHPSVGLPFSQQEGLYFQLFRMQTANELSGFFDDIFWSRSVLVECHSEAAIRHAVVALGALYKTLEKTTESPPNSPSEVPYDTRDSAYGHWEVALKQYSSACHELAVVSAQDERTQRTRLMASVLLACFDSFIGDHKQAIVQIQTGLALLERLRVERRRSQGPLAAAEPVEDELTQMFTRLAIQAKSYDMAFHFPQPYVIHLLSVGATSGTSEPSDTSPASSPPASSDVGSPVSTHQDPIPEQFVSLREARLAWDTLCEHIFRFMELMFQYANGPPNLLPKSMTRFGLEFKARIEAWSDAFEPLLIGRANPGVSSQEKAGIAVLKMFQIMGQILYLMTFSDSEMKFDAFQMQFKAIVDLACEVVGDEERRAAAARCPDPTRCVHHFHNTHAHDANFDREQHKGFEYRTSHIKASFSADLGIVPPLYVVATKSRDRVLRRQAIQLLRSSARREGMWDSELVARIGMWVVDIEEEGEEEEFIDAMNRRHGSSGSIHSNGAMARNTANSARTYSTHTLTPGGSPASPPTLREQSFSSSMDSQARNGSVDFGEIPLGPGGNARWDTRRASQASVLHTTSPWGQSFSAPLDETLPYYMQLQRPIPAQKRILVKACEFDLREHTATLKCGTRGLVAGAPDIKTRVTQIKW